MYDDDDGCRSCGRRDYGFDLPDVRSTLFERDCACATACTCTDDLRSDLGLAEGACACACADQCGCDETRIDIRINRIWDRECSVCGGCDWRPEWSVLKDGKSVATVPTEEAARAVVRVLFPSAEEERDPAWESERYLRLAEGWE